MDMDYTAEILQNYQNISVEALEKLRSDVESEFETNNKKRNLATDIMDILIDQKKEDIKGLNKVGKKIEKYRSKTRKAVEEEIEYNQDLRNSIGELAIKIPELEETYSMSQQNMEALQRIVSRIGQQINTSTKRTIESTLEEKKKAEYTGTAQTDEGLVATMQISGWEKYKLKRQISKDTGYKKRHIELESKNTYLDGRVTALYNVKGDPYEHVLEEPEPETQKEARIQTRRQATTQEDRERLTTRIGDKLRNAYGWMKDKVTRSKEQSKYPEGHPLRGVDVSRFSERQLTTLLDKCEHPSDIDDVYSAYADIIIEEQAREKAREYRKILLN